MESQYLHVLVLGYLPMEQEIPNKTDTLDSSLREKYKCT